MKTKAETKKNPKTKSGNIAGNQQRKDLRMEGPIAEKDEVKQAEERTQEAQNKANSMKNQ
jgi:hypothetical protein